MKKVISNAKDAVATELVKRGTQIGHIMAHPVPLVGAVIACEISVAAGIGLMMPVYIDTINERNEGNRELTHVLERFPNDGQFDCTTASGDVVTISPADMAAGKFKAIVSRDNCTPHLFKNAKFASAEAK